MPEHIALGSKNLSVWKYQLGIKQQFVTRGKVAIFTPS
jgi:hypothetical protein